MKPNKVVMRTGKGAQSRSFQWYIAWLLLIACALPGIGCRKGPNDGDNPACGDTETSGPDGSRNTPDHAASVAIIVALFDSMPHWTKISYFADNVVERALIEAHVRQIATYDLDSIREAMDEYRHAKGPEGETQVDGDFFVLNNFLFNLPRTMRRDSPQLWVCSGWAGAPEDGDRDNPRDSDVIDTRWPWSEAGDATMRLTGKYECSFGAGYDGIRVFDYCRKVFGRRRAMR